MLDTKQIMKTPQIVSHEGSNKVKTLFSMSLDWLEASINKATTELEQEKSIIQKISIIYNDNDKNNTYYQAIIFYKAQG